MLTQLTTLKARLKIEATYLVEDDLLTNFIKLVSGRFEKECNRRFARLADATEEFAADEKEFTVARYPIETITAWHLKSNETDGWVAQTDVVPLIRRGCLISLSGPLGTSAQIGRVTYDGGYVLPGTTASGVQTALPDDLEQACVEQCAELYRNRNHSGLATVSGEGATLNRVGSLDLLPFVQQVVEKYERYRN